MHSTDPLSDGRIVARGTFAELASSSDATVRDVLDYIRHGEHQRASVDEECFVSVRSEPDDQDDSRLYLLSACSLLYSSVRTDRRFRS
jgi:hypothetical protein